MLPTELQEFITRTEAVSDGSTFRGRCPLCQPHEDDADRFKLQLSAGRKYPLLLYCFHCGAPGDSAHNRQVVRAVCQSLGLSFGLLCSLASVEEITALWAGCGSTYQQGVQPAATAVLNLVYRDVLSRLTLSDRHSRWLSRRGMRPERAAAAGYRTAPAIGSHDLSLLVDSLVGRWGQQLDSVPGFVGVSVGRPKLLVREESPLLTPCRNRGGEIVAIKQRLSSKGRSRMRLLSSKFGGGPAAVTTCHYPYDFEFSEPLWVVEGERKAEVWAESVASTVAVPGTRTWRCVLPEITTLGAKSVVLAFDQDEAGRIGQQQLGRALVAEGVDVRLAVWAEGKGIDDATTKGITIRLEEWVDDGGAEKDFNPHPQPKGSSPAFSRGQRLSDSQIVPYLLQFGRTLRSELHCYPPTLSQLIRDGSVRMVKTDQGQEVEANE